MHTFKSLSVVANIVVVHGKGRVVEANVWMVNPQKSLRQHNSLGLKLDCLQKVAKFELDRGYVRNALRHFFIHRSLHLQKHTDDLGVYLEGLLERALLLGLIPLRHHISNVNIGALNLLHIGE